MCANRATRADQPRITIRKDYEPSGWWFWEVTYQGKRIGGSAMTKWGAKYEARKAYYEIAPVEIAP